MHYPHLKTRTGMTQLPPDVDLTTWDIGRSGDLGAGVEVWTSWLPVQGYFETLVVDRDGALREYVADSTSYNSTDALARHSMIVQRVRQVLAAQGIA